jgi:hypothetical protein
VYRGSERSGSTPAHGSIDALAVSDRSTPILYAGTIGGGRFRVTGGGVGFSSDKENRPAARADGAILREPLRYCRLFSPSWWLS